MVESRELTRDEGREMGGGDKQHVSPAGPEPGIDLTLTVLFQLRALVYSRVLHL